MNQNDKPTRLLFLDRDGIINEDKGYVGSINDVSFIPAIFTVIATFVDHGFLPVVVTNQSGIGRGYYSEDDFFSLSRWMQDRFTEHGLPHIPVYYCPHHPTKALPPYQQECQCRKPGAGMLLKAASQLNADLSQSILIGDSWRDIQAGVAAGLPSQCYVNKQPAPTLNASRIFQTQNVADIAAKIPDIIAASKSG
ncbi:D-glycero-alpha-D-manno-heptose-1,7-bisphosphate 7-phosphatase [Salinimonas chungwhensis]|uniref:D-glycero-alpha-D-manno-heptose-1,7-bisphosphate 7-phosphatase n=1 Tax=Salinimonas chungwhensis TaxID=265425 RepID=UPI000366DD6E|nr:HAD family hydrolase [Salinimonas chungwhensis]